MATIVIDKSQYRNFSCKLGKKNKITKVIGNEYIIDASTSTAYEEGNYEGSPTGINGTTAPDASYDSGTMMAFFDWSADYYLRHEIATRKVSYEFTITGRTITNLDKMTAKYTLYYNKYSSSQKLINSGNYSSSKSTIVFAGIRNNSNRPDSSKDDDGNYSEYDASTNTTIPTGMSYVKYSGESMSYYVYPLQMPEHICTVTYVSKKRNADGVNFDYTFRVDFTFAISSGHNVVSLNWWTGNEDSQEVYFNEVVKVRIEVSGYTVSKEEVNSAYTQDGDESKVLELQTNELMQQSVESVSVGAGQRVVSFNDVADEIITAYKDNRLIATFDLINNRRYEIDGELRYLRAGDRIKIKDLEDKYLSSSYMTGDGNSGNDFEIIKANSRYEGFYYKEIVAKEILPAKSANDGDGESGGSSGSNGGGSKQTYDIAIDTMSGGGSGNPQITCQKTAAEGETVAITIKLLSGMSLGTVEIRGWYSEREISFFTEKQSDTLYRITFRMPAEDVDVVIRYTGY